MDYQPGDQVFRLSSPFTGRGSSIAEVDALIRGREILTVRDCNEEGCHLTHPSLDYSVYAYFRRFERAVPKTEDEIYLDSFFRKV